MDILKNTEAMGKRIFADLEKINFIRTSTSAEETKAANIIKDELAKEEMEATIEELTSKPPTSTRYRSRHWARSGRFRDTAAPAPPRRRA